MDDRALWSSPAAGCVSVIQNPMAFGCLHAWDPWKSPLAKVKVFERHRHSGTSPKFKESHLFGSIWMWYLSNVSFWNVAWRWIEQVSSRQLHPVRPDCRDTQWCVAKQVLGQKQTPFFFAKFPIPDIPRKISSIILQGSKFPKKSEVESFRKVTDPFILVALE